MFDSWKLEGFLPGEGAKSGVFSESYDDSQWVDIPVPGDVHRALIAAGRLADPFYDQNELQAAWVEEREWWYRLRFDGPTEPLQAGERLQLVFHGLDTFVTLWLNGEELGRHQNMFTEAVFDVTNRLRIGQPNVLALCFDRPLDHVGDEEAFHPWGRNNERIFMRKAQFGYGWDWGPRLPTVGIWRPVELRRQRYAALQGVHFYTLELAPDHSSALVAVKVAAERFATDQPLSAHVHLSGPDGTSIDQKLLPNPVSATAYLQIDKPQLWWTHDLGAPTLYSLDVTLMQAGQELDKWHSEVGIRTIELDQTPDPEEPGTRFFRFVLNGVPIFAKGADWIPADSFVGAIPDSRYEMLLTATRDANMNMLRIWGGGIYEHDSFYDLCDRLGLLLWHDFMFACAPYPDFDTAFVAEVDAEARYQVRRLRNHPSMALWCGNNENQWLHEMRYWQQPEYHVPGSLFYNETLPKAVAELDGQTPYWPGSPYGGSDYNGAEDGDRHNWQVWHGGLPRRFSEEPKGNHTPEGVSFIHYAEDMGRFISEFGMHASPVLETLKRNIPADQLYHHSPSMDHHNKDNPKNKGDNLMMTVTGLPATLEDYVDFSMIAQAEGLKFGIEHYRRRTPHCSGTLFWQLNDCWPVLSWSVLDYYGFGKAGYYYTRRAYAPVLASFKAVPTGIELWITNDSLTDLHDTVAIRLATFAGQIVREEKFAVDVPAQTSQSVYHWAADQLAGGNDQYLVVRSTMDSFPVNRHFFAAIKDLQRTAVQPKVDIEQADDHELHVRLETPEYAYFVHLTCAVNGTHFSDNYFDLEAGEVRTITVNNPVVALTVDAVEVHSR